MTNNYVKNKLK